jgi:DNA-binding PadR family transcriptional regulator
MLDLAILGLLDAQALHGYELKKRLLDVVGSRLAVSFGSLYPALSRLEKVGAVHVVAPGGGAAGPPMPMTGSLGAEVAAARARRPRNSRGQRNKKVYAITAAGRERLHELLTAVATDERTFAVQLAFCGLLDREQRLELLTRRQRDLHVRLADLPATADAARPGGRASEGRVVGQWPGDRYRRAVRDREIVTLTSELAWLDDLIAHESDGADHAADDRALEPVSRRDANEPNAAAGNAHADASFSDAPSAPAVVTQTTPSTLHPGPTGPPTLSGGFPR